MYPFAFRLIDDMSRTVIAVALVVARSEKEAYAKGVKILANGRSVAQLWETENLAPFQTSQTLPNSGVIPPSTT